jgi:hypothetical protein
MVTWNFRMFSPQTKDNKLSASLFGSGVAERSALLFSGALGERNRFFMQQRYWETPTL